jgi:hypothetical protein
MKCRSVELSVNWNVCQLNCRSIESVGQSKCRTIKIPLFPREGLKCFQWLLNDIFVQNSEFFFLIQNEKKLMDPLRPPLSTKSWKGFHDIPRSASFHLGVISISSRIPFCLAELKGLRVGKKKIDALSQQGWTFLWANEKKF